MAFDVLDLLQTQPGLSQRKIAERLAISLGQVNFFLKSFHADELVERAAAPADSHPNAENYVLTAKGQAERALLEVRVLPIKLIELDRLRIQIERLTGNLS